MQLISGIAREIGIYRADAEQKRADHLASLTPQDREAIRAREAAAADAKRRAAAARQAAAEERRRASTIARCPHRSSPGAAFCPDCGVKLAPKTCIGCGTSLPQVAAFCTGCGASVS